MDNKRHYLFLYKQEFDMKEMTGMAWQAISVLEKKYHLYDINNTEKMDLIQGRLRCNGLISSPESLLICKELLHCKGKTHQK